MAEMGHSDSTCESSLKSGNVTKRTKRSNEGVLEIVSKIASERKKR